MKVYKISDHSLALIDRGGYFWHIYVNLPNTNDVKIGEAMYGAETEKKAKEEGIEISPEQNKIFNSLIEKKNNYKPLLKFFSDNIGMTEKEFNNVLRFDRKLIELTGKCIHNSKRNVSDFEFGEIYQGVKSVYESWGNNKERILEWSKRYIIPNALSFDSTLVDIWDCPDHRRYQLLYDFHNHWGDELDSYITQAIELYPEDNDFDKRYYYVEESIRKEREETLKRIKELRNAKCNNG